jgi:hypothetical protein
MMIILKANKVNLFVSSVLFVFWYHSPNVLDTPHIYNVSRLRVNWNVGLVFLCFRKIPADVITVPKHAGV